MKKFFVIVTLIVSLFVFLGADVYVKQETKTPSFMGQPAKNVIQEQWLGNNRMATISADSSMVLDLSAKKMLMIQHKSKTYIEMSLPLDITKMMPEQMAAMMKGMMDSMTVSIKPNGQSKKIKNWDTKGYDAIMKMMGMEVKMVFWAATNPGFDWKKYSGLFNEVYKAQFRMGEKFIAEFKKIEGYPIETETTVMGMTITNSTVEVNPNKTPGPDVYKVPAGYTKKDKLSMEDMQQK